MAEDEIVVACTSVILVSLGAASVMADAMADAKKKAQTQNSRRAPSALRMHLWSHPTKLLRFARH